MGPQLFYVVLAGIALLVFSAGTKSFACGFALFAFVYYTCIQHWDYFSRNNVPYIRGVPFLGAMWEMVLARKAFMDIFLKFYNRYPNDDIIGIFETFGRPVYVVRDPELARQVFVKDFDHFVNHRISVPPELDPILGRSIFITRDERWRTLRSTISPAFTGSKMRLMMSLVSECARSFSTELHKEMAGKANVVDMKHLLGQFACDTITTAAFGLDVNSRRDPDNDFYKRGMEASNFGGVQSLKFLGYASIPTVLKFFGVRFFNEEQTEFFRNLLHGNMRYREEHNIIRHDMVNLLLEAKNGKLRHVEAEDIRESGAGFATVEESNVGKSDNVIQKWEDDDLVAQSMLFILAGFNAIALSTAFMAHEVAMNQEIQQRLYEEIVEETGRDNDKTISYEKLQSMKYLDQVVCETLRRWPVGGAQDRAVTKPYDLVTRDGRTIKLQKGDGLWVVVSGFQLDGKYFSDPLRFDPDRFSDENKHNIQSGTYLPFGDGPRNCVGSRFALMEMKALFVHLLKDFTLHKSEKTMDPIDLKKGSMMMEPITGFWLELRPRN